MKLSKKQLALIALAIVLVISNIAFAVLYMTRDVTITGGVSVIGSIMVYQDDGTTPLANIDFDNFTGGTAEFHTYDFFINNTGNQPVYVYWNISASSISWEIFGQVYKHIEDLEYKYEFLIQNATSHFWLPDTQGVQLDVDEGATFHFILFYTGNVKTAEVFDLTATFYAQDA